MTFTSDNCLSMDRVRRRLVRASVGALISAVLLTACGAPDTPPESETPTASTPAPTSGPVPGVPPATTPSARSGSSTADPPPDMSSLVGSVTGTAPGSPAGQPAAGTVAELPGGGQVMFPGRRLVALYGHPQMQQGVRAARPTDPGHVAAVGESNSCHFLLTVTRPLPCDRTSRPGCCPAVLSRVSVSGRSTGVALPAAASLPAGCGHLGEGPRGRRFRCSTV